MNTLQKMYPSLTTFSDLNWDVVGQEYEATSIDVSFPQYLQFKAEAGDCPPYLFEIAYYEMAIFNTSTSTEPFPFKPGIYLNPTALFLSLEFDVLRMLKEAEAGKIEVHQRDHVLCIYRDAMDEVKTLELDEEALLLLQELENGPLMEYKKEYKPMVDEGVIIDCR